MTSNEVEKELGEILVSLSKYLTSVEDKSPFETIQEDRAEIKNITTQILELINKHYVARSEK